MPSTLQAQEKTTETVESVEKEKCKFCLTRDQVDRLNAIILSENDCRKELIECRKEPWSLKDSGWNPATVLLIGIGITAIAFGGGLVLGLSI